MVELRLCVCVCVCVCVVARLLNCTFLWRTERVYRTEKSALLEGR